MIQKLEVKTKFVTFFVRSCVLASDTVIHFYNLFKVICLLVLVGRLQEYLDPSISLVKWLRLGYANESKTNNDKLTGVGNTLERSAVYIPIFTLSVS